MVSDQRVRRLLRLDAQGLPRRAAKGYLGTLHAAALAGEAAVEPVLDRLAQRLLPLSAQAVQTELRRGKGVAPAAEAPAGAVDLSLYDGLLQSKEAVDEGG
jgi:hypothetical protein